MAIFSDNDTRPVTQEAAVSWTTSDPNIVSIANQGAEKGTAKAESVGGPVTITATASVDGDVFRATAEMTVTDAIITSLTVTPTTHTLAKGMTRQYKATAYLSDGTSSIDVTQDAAITWSSDGSAVSVNSQGFAKGEQVARRMWWRRGEHQKALCLQAKAI